MTELEHKTITKSLARVKNVSFILDILFQPLPLVPTAREQELERKEKAYEYLKKYATLTLKESVQDIKDIMDKLPIETQESKQEIITHSRTIHPLL